MKFANLVRILRQNADLDHAIRLSVGSPMLASAPFNFSKKAASVMFKNYVEQKVNFIAFREYSPLNLDAENAEFHSRKACGIAGARQRSIYVSYTVWFQIVDEEEAGHRAAFVDSTAVPGVGQHEVCLTVQQVINSRIRWHQLYWAKQGKSIRFNAVIKKTTEWERLDQSDKLLTESIEIYRLPAELFTFPGKSEVAA